MKKLILATIATLFITAQITNAATVEKSFAEAHRVYVSEIAAAIEKTKKAKLKDLNNNFTRQTDLLDNDLKNLKRSLEIDLLRFVKKRSQTKYTPFALFQLGSLYFQLAEDKSYYYKEAEKYFQFLLRKYPKFKHREETYYLLAYTLLQQEKEAAAIRIFKKLLREFPKSRFLHESQLRIAEYFFHKQRYKQALPYYRNILTAGEKNQFFLKALYKTAWVYYLTRDYQKALRNFYRVVARGANTEFYQEAKDYVAFSLSKTDARTNAIERLRSLGWNQDSYDICMTYGKLLAENGQYKTAASLYLRLANQFPKQERAPEALYQASRSLKLQGEMKRALTVERDFLTRYPQKDPTKKKILFSLASYYYEAWRTRTLTAASLNQARRYFKEIVRNYPYSQEAYDSSFFGAEASFILEEYSEASLDYQQVLLNPSYNYHFEDALQSIIICQERRMQLATDKATQKLLAEQLLLSLDDHLKRSKRDKDHPKILYKSAQTLFVLDRTDEAVSRLQQVLRDYPKRPLTDQAAEEIVAIFAKSKQWRKVIAWGDVIGGMDTLYDKPGLQERIGLAQFDAKIAIAKKLEEENLDTLSAANKYFDIHRDFRNQQDADKILLYSAELYNRAEKPTLAKETLEEYFKLYGKANRDAEQGALQLFELYSADLQLNKAIVSSQNYGGRSFEVSLKAAELAAVQNKPVLARSLYDKARSLMKTVAQRAAYFERVALFEEGQSNYQSALRAYKSYAQITKLPAAHLGAARNALLLKNPITAEASIKAARKRRKRMTLVQQAEYYFLLGELWHLYFVRTSATNGDDINPKKLDFLERAEKYYLQAIDLKDAFWISASLYKLAETYSIFASEIQAAGSVELSNKLKQKARDIHDNNLKSSAENESYNIWARRSLQWLYKQYPSDYPIIDDLQIVSSVKLHTPPYRKMAAEALPKIELEYAYEKRLLPELVSQVDDLIDRDKDNPEIIALLEFVTGVEGVPFDAAYNLALTYYHHANYQRCRNILEKATELKRHPDAMLLYANVLFKMSRFKQAEKWYSDILRRYPSAKPVEVNLAMTELKTARHTKALSRLVAILRRGYRSADVWYLVSEILAAKGQRELSLAVLERALEDYPENLLIKSGLLYRQLKSNQITQQIIVEQRVKQSSDYGYLNNIGVLLYKQGSFKQAESYIRASLAAEVTDAALYNLAASQYSRGDIDAAKETFAKLAQPEKLPPQLKKALN